MTISDKQLRKENDVLKTNVIQLRTNSDAMKDENEQLKIEVNMMKAKVVKLITENDELKIENDEFKARLDTSESLHPPLVPQSGHKLDEG